MSNYVDTTATRSVSRPCSCPGDDDAGQPHEQDTADVRVAFGYGEKALYRQAGYTRSGGAVFSTEDAKMAVLALGVVRWNLVRPDGSARPVTSEEIARLDEPTVDWLYKELTPAVAEAPLPNASGAPSRNGSRVSAGPTPTTSPKSTST